MNRKQVAAERGNRKKRVVDSQVADRAREGLIKKKICCPRFLSKGSMAIFLAVHKERKTPLPQVNGS